MHKVCILFVEHWSSVCWTLGTVHKACHQNCNNKPNTIIVFIIVNATVFVFIIIKATLYTKIRLLQACHKQICCKTTTGLYLKLLHTCYLSVACQLQSCYKCVTCLSSTCFDSCYTQHGQPLYTTMMDLIMTAIVFIYHECHL